MTTVTPARTLLCLIAVVVMSGSPHRLMAQKGMLPEGRFSISTQENYYRFDTGLFSMDSNLKKYPADLSGFGSSATLTTRIGRTFGINVEIVQNRTSGSGEWLDVGGLSPEEAAYSPVATGNTELHIVGAIGGIRKSVRIGKVILYGEGGAGAGILNVHFHGTVQAIDPSDGQPFTVDARDSVRHYIPLGSGGGGLEVPLRRNLSLLTSYHWELGSAVGVGLKYTLFRPSR